MKLNLHGVVGTIAILILIGIAYVKNSFNVWSIVAGAIAIYAIEIITFTNNTRKLEKGRPTSFSTHPVTYDINDNLLYIWGYHCAIIILAFSLLPNNRFIQLTFALLCLPIGLAIPNLILFFNNKWILNRHGILGIFAMSLIVIMAFWRSYPSLAPSWIFFVASLLLYSIAINSFYRYKNALRKKNYG